MNDDDVDRQFSRMTGAIHTTVPPDQWHRRAPTDKELPTQAVPHQLGALRLVVAVATLVTLLTGYWIGAAEGPIGDWAKLSTYAFWLVWVFVLVPGVALAVASVAAPFLDLGEHPGAETVKALRLGHDPAGGIPMAIHWDEDRRHLMAPTRAWLSPGVGPRTCGTQCPYRRPTPNWLRCRPR